jgi:phosphoketolase
MCSCCDVSLFLIREIAEKCVQENPLLTKILDKSHIKKRLLGHWGTTAGVLIGY